MAKFALKRALELAPVVEAAIDTLHPTAEAKNIKVETKIAASDKFVSGDFDRLQQVVWNLLSNAIKFTQADGSIEVKLRYTEANAQIIISDNGVGISEESLPFIFERFYQIGTPSEHRGLGLGLAIVRHLVELHGGRVTAESAGVGRGATFTVHLPLLPSRVSSATDAAASEHALVNNNSSFNDSMKLQGVTILLIDDETDSREVVAMMLKLCGAEVWEASSSRAAFEIITKESADAPPRVLVCDIAMPEEDGYEFISKLRAFEAKDKANIPAVALTAHAREADCERALTAGFQEYLSKPVEPAELIEVISKLAGRARKFSTAKADDKTSHE